MMWSKTKSQESSSKSSFHVVIKLDSFEVQRRIKYHCDDRILACEEVHHAMMVIDPDFTFRRAITSFTQEVKELYREVRQGYVPERAYLAGGVLEIEDIFRNSKALVADMRAAGGVSPGCEGWCLRMQNIRVAIELLEDGLEEMRDRARKGAGWASDEGA